MVTLKPASMSKAAERSPAMPAPTTQTCGALGLMLKSAMIAVWADCDSTGSLRNCVRVFVALFEDARPRVRSPDRTFAQ